MGTLPRGRRTFADRADAKRCRPDRWLSPPEAIAGVPGVWGHLLTFLGGPHACIGYRFSLTEYVPPPSPLRHSALSSSNHPRADRSPFRRMKALVFTLIRAFEFEFAVPEDDIADIGAFIQRPGLRSEQDKGGQLPLLVRPVKRG